MQLVSGIVLGGWVVVIGISWLVAKLNPGLGTAMSFTANMAVRVFASLLLALAAVRAGESGGAWIAIAVVFAVIAVATFLTTLMIIGGAVLAWRRDQLGEHS